MDLSLLGTLAPGLENQSVPLSKEDAVVTVVDDGNAIVDKWKGHSITY